MTLMILTVAGVWLLVVMMAFIHFRFLTLEAAFHDLDKRCNEMHRRVLWQPINSTGGDDHE